ncbi:hypothetical protein N0V90_002764 [Kalmusia sp. IMI 367209]|nr:hypothetical protein N0V90_002764 [Kalmusia sp. IMI 367209]
MSTPGLSIISSQRVFPTNPHSAPTTTSLSIIDASVARFSPCGAIWFLTSRPVPRPDSDEFPDTLSSVTLRVSLEHTLSAYPQWAGQLRMVPYQSSLQERINEERYGRMEVRYGYGHEKDPGVVFVIAQTESRMNDALPGRGEKMGLYACDEILREDVLLPSIRLASYASQPEHTDPSVTVQITHFSCGGTAIGIQMAHCLADAITLSHFVHDWSATHEALASKSPPPELHPVFEPRILDDRAAKSVDDIRPDKKTLGTAYKLPLHRYDWWSSSENAVYGPVACAVPGPLRDEPTAQEIAAQGSKMPWSTYDVRAPVSHIIIHYTSSQLYRIWAAATNGGTAASRHDALVAHVWTLINRARGPENGDKDAEVHADIAVGLRTRVSPPLPSNYLGSPLQIAKTTLSWSTAASSDALPTIASSIKSTLLALTPAALAAQIYATAHELAPFRLWQAFLGRQHMLVTSWAHTQGCTNVRSERKGPRDMYIRSCRWWMDACKLWKGRRRARRRGKEGSGMIMELMLQFILREVPWGGWQKIQEYGFED